jgi:hypothetical protein
MLTRTIGSEKYSVIGLGGYELDALIPLGPSFG